MSATIKNLEIEFEIIDGGPPTAIQFIQNIARLHKATITLVTGVVDNMVKVKYQEEGSSQLIYLDLFLKSLGLGGLEPLKE